LSDNYDDTKRYDDTSQIDPVKSSLTEFNGLMELDISQLSEATPTPTPRLPPSKAVDCITERTNEEDSSKADHVSKLTLTMESKVNTYRESLKRSSIDSLMSMKQYHADTGPNSSQK
jgi:hypothetical protein